MLPFYLDYVLWGVVGLMLAYYLGLPLLLHCQMRFPAVPQVEQLDLDRVKPSVAEFLMSRTRDLHELGFGETTLVKMPYQAPHIRTYLAMLVNRESGDKAMVTAMLGDQPGMKTLYVEFSTRFETGHMFDTVNSAELNAFPPQPLTIRTQVPQVRDVGELYDLHRFVMKKHDVNGKKVLYERGAALDYLINDVFIKPYDEQVERGWLYHDAAENVYRTTIRGSYLISWGLLQPFKGLRTLAMRRRARRILQEFDGAQESREK
jgi:hypothetical protein